MRGRASRPQTTPHARARAGWQHGGARAYPQGNQIFLGSFFKTAYTIGKPFVTYIIAAFCTIGIAEALHHFPGLGALNAFGFDHLALQLALLLCGALLYTALTSLSYNKACANFERIDL